jgi:hypothetical protein
MDGGVRSPSEYPYPVQTNMVNMNIHTRITYNIIEENSI